MAQLTVTIDTSHPRFMAAAAATGLKGRELASRLLDLGAGAAIKPAKTVKTATRGARKANPSAPARKRGEREPMTPTQCEKTLKAARKLGLKWRGDAKVLAALGLSPA